MLKAARYCGAVPLLLGISIYLLWLLTRADWLMIAGLAVLIAGLLSVLAGFVLLVVHLYKAYETSPSESRGTSFTPVFLIACLLVSNFIIAAGILASFDRIMREYTVTVRNHGARPLEQCRLQGAADIAMDAIAPMREQKTTFVAEHEGTLRLSCVQNGKPNSTIVDEYISTSGGGRRTVIVNEHDMVVTAR